jgi:hypothetical protein
MSKQLEGILGRATRATASEVTLPKPVVVMRPEPEALLQARVPASVVDDLKLMAAQRKNGWTVRRILLEALQAYGVKVPEGELRDRRK